MYCVTCYDRHGFENANHHAEFMLELVDEAHAIAQFPELDQDFVEIKTPYGRIRPAWFKEHASHDLVARSEYGKILRSPRDCTNGCSAGSHCASPLLETASQQRKPVIVAHRGCFDDVNGRLTYGIIPWMIEAAGQSCALCKQPVYGEAVRYPGASFMSTLGMVSDVLELDRKCRTEE